MVSGVSDIVRFGRAAASRYWLGIRREDDALLYQAMPSWEKVLFWWGVIVVLRGIYPWVDALIVGLASASLLLVVILGGGPF